MQIEQCFIWLVNLSQHLLVVKGLVIAAFIECCLIKLPVSLGCRYLVRSQWRGFLNEITFPSILKWKNFPILFSTYSSFSQTHLRSQTCSRNLSINFRKIGVTLKVV